MIAADFGPDDVKGSFGQTVRKGAAPQGCALDKRPPETAIAMSRSGLSLHPEADRPGLAFRADATLARVGAFRGAQKLQAQGVGVRATGASRG